MNKVSAEVIKHAEVLLKVILWDYRDKIINMAEARRRILDLPQLAIVDRNPYGKVIVYFGEIAIEIPVEKIKEQGFVKEVK